MPLNTFFRYSYAPGVSQIFNLLIGFGMIGAALYLFLCFEIDSTRIVLITTFCLLSIMPLFMTLHYFVISKNIIIEIFTDKNKIEVILNEGKIILKLEDLMSIQIYEHKGLGLYEFYFNYAKYNFKNGKYFIVTNFMTDEYFVPTVIKPEIKKEFLPIIWKRINL